MKNQDNRNARKNRKRKTLSKLFARSPRVSAHLTQEHEWETDVPNIRLSRAFVIVLAIHVVAVGGIIAFEVMQPNSAPVVDRGAGPEAETEALPAAPEATAPKEESAVVAAPAPLSDGPTLRHIVGAGDDVRTILEQYGITRSDIATASGHPLAATQEPFQGQVLTIHNARRGMPSSDGSVPVMASDRARTIPTAPVTQAVDPSLPAAQYTAENNPAMDRMPEPVALEDELPKPTDDFMPLGGESEYALLDDEDTISQDFEPVVPPIAPKSEAPKSAAPKVRASIPVSPPAGEIVSPKAVAKESAVSGSSHTVQAGDTAYAIGRKYGVKPDALLKANGISDPSALRIGAVLRIPR